MVEEIEEDRILSEIAHSKNRSLQDLLRRMRYGESSLQDRAKRKQEERLKEKGKKRAEYEERLKQYEEELSYEVMEKIFKEDVDEIAQKIAGDELRKELEQKVRELRYQPEGLSQEDLEQSLEEYIKRGEIDLEEGKIKITPKGARKLARNMLRRILENLAAKEIGPHSLEEAGYGVELSISSRRYELGDEYEKIDFERTFLNALEGNLQKGKISLKTKDFQVYQEIHQTRLCSGLIIDESGSMSGDKSNAAMDTALALSELIRREPKDSLKVYLFSQKVREIPYYDILNASFSGGTTDIKSALRAFRKGVSREKGDKQAYLITDTEPNTEDGRYVGLKEATSGIIQEALYYRQAGITLNIIMLDQSPKLKELASIVAKRNLGRVFFTCPLNLGKIAVEDYLVSKRKIL
jgi:uncharacterized protein with von Willebrand factor type A (vWA) domain